MIGKNGGSIGLERQRRIASFDRRAIAAAKNLVNQVSLPYADRLLDAITSFQTALTWPEAQQRIQNVLQRGLQRDSDFETHWPEVLGTILETQSCGDHGDVVAYPKIGTGGSSAP